jgi:hypothetical protein
MRTKTLHHNYSRVRVNFDARIETITQKSCVGNGPIRWNESMTQVGSPPYGHFVDTALDFAGYYECYLNDDRRSGDFDACNVRKTNHLATLCFHTDG